MNEEHLFQIWCLYLFYKASYDKKLIVWKFMTSCTICNATQHMYISDN